MALPEQERSRLGEILARFYVNGPMRHRLLNGDPHPGNSLFLADGRVAFLDFGFFKTMSDEEVCQLMASTLATYEHDAQALWEQAGHYYLLGYTPTAHPRDLHSIDVSMERSNLHVLARHFRGD